MSEYMDPLIEQLNRMMMQILGIVLVITILLVVLWIIFEAYPSWKRLKADISRASDQLFLNGHK